jgi:hypothetical protein
MKSKRGWRGAAVSSVGLRDQNKDHPSLSSVAEFALGLFSCRKILGSTTVVLFVLFDNLCLIMD